MIYAVSKYLDQIKDRTEKHDPIYQDQYIYFDTEQEAKDCIVERARDTLRNAEGQVYLARKRLARVVKKFGVSCKHGIADQGLCGLCHDEQSAPVIKDRREK